MLCRLLDKYTIKRKSTCNVSLFNSLYNYSVYFFLGPQTKAFENIVGKGESAGNQHFLLFFFFFGGGGGGERWGSKDKTNSIM